MASVDPPLGGERLHRLEPAAELGGRGAQGELGVDAEVPGHVDHREQHVPELAGDVAVVRPVDRPRSSASSSSTLAYGPATSGQSKPTLAALRCRWWA